MYKNVYNDMTSLWQVRDREIKDEHVLRVYSTMYSTKKILLILEKKKHTLSSGFPKGEA